MTRSHIRPQGSRHLAIALIGVIGLAAACSRSPVEPERRALPFPGDDASAISVFRLQERPSVDGDWATVDVAARPAPPFGFVTPRGSGATIARGGTGPHLAAAGSGTELAIDGARTNLSFNGVPGRDGRVDTEDDVLFGAGDFYGSGGTRAIDTEYLPVGVRFELAGLVTTVGGGYNPDGSPNTGTQVILMSVAYSGYPVSPMRIRFDRPQTTITFDLFAQINATGSAAPVTLRDAEGNVVRSFMLTYLDAILGGFSPTFLGGRFLVASATPFSSIEIGLTIEGGGWFFDNLAFEPEYTVRHVPIDVPAKVNPITPSPMRVVVLSGEASTRARSTRRASSWGTDSRVRGATAHNSATWTATGTSTWSRRSRPTKSASLAMRPGWSSPGGSGMAT